MTPRQAVWNHLKNDASVRGLVGGRIYHVSPPQDTTLPLIVIDTVSNTDRRDLAGVAYTETRLQVTAIAESLAKAEEIALAVRASLEGFRGLMGGAGDYWLQAGSYVAQVEGPSGGLDVMDSRVAGYLPTHLPEVGQHHYAVDIVLTY